MENKFEDRSRKESRSFAGVILIIVGAAWLLRNSGFPLPSWLFSWPVLLILIGLYSGVKHNFKNNFWLIMVGTGGFFLVNMLIPGMSLEPYFWPIAIIVLGVIFILRPGRNDRQNNSVPETGPDGENLTTGWQQADNTISQPISSDLLTANSVFSGVKKNIVSKNFQGGKISCVFGGADIDLTKAEINGKTDLNLEVVFGGVKLIIPPHWTVVNEIDGVFHGIDDKRKFATTADANPDKMLVLRGSVVFGGVEIRSY